MNIATNNKAVATGVSYRIEPDGRWSWDTVALRIERMGARHQSISEIGGYVGNLGDITFTIDLEYLANVGISLQDELDAIVATLWEPITEDEYIETVYVPYNPWTETRGHSKNRYQTK